MSEKDAIEEAYRAPLEDDDADSAAPHEALALSMAPTKLALMYVATLGSCSRRWITKRAI